MSDSVEVLQDKVVALTKELGDSLVMIAIKRKLAEAGHAGSIL